MRYVSFNGEAFGYFLVSYLLVLHLGVVVDLILSRLRGKRIAFKGFIWICCISVGLILAIFVSLIEGLKGGLQMRALSMGFVSSITILTLVFGGSAVVTQQITSAIMRFYGVEITDGIKDELRRVFSKGEGNGS